MYTSRPIQFLSRFIFASVIFVVTYLSVTLLSSCDKIDNPYLPQYVDVDTTLFSGVTLQEYKNTLWPTFTTNANTNRNVLIEDFTGHKCVNCPYAAKTATDIEEANENRVFVASIHAGPDGSTGFQTTSGSNFSTNFTNPQGLEISKQISKGGGFVGNPSGTISRKTFGGQLFQNYSGWSNYTAGILTENALKINLQAGTNYFPTTRGLILHTEIDVKVPVSNDVYQVVYLIEDSLVAPQITPPDWEVPNLDKNYVHHDIHRGCIDGKAMGRKLTEADKKDKDGKIIAGDKYYLNYSYKLPAQYNPTNMHLLIFVYDSKTFEIYQVIRKNIM